jgi:hypothetical protein
MTPATITDEEIDTDLLAAPVTASHDDDGDGTDGDDGGADDGDGDTGGGDDDGGADA